MYSGFLFLAQLTGSSALYVRVDPDGLDLGPLGHSVDQGHELAVRGELPGLDHVQGGVSGVFLINDAQRISMSLIILNLILDESVAIEHSGGLHISSIRGCLREWLV